LLILMTRQEHSKSVTNLFQPRPKSWSDTLPASCAPHAHWIRSKQCAGTFLPNPPRTPKKNCFVWRYPGFAHLSLQEYYQAKGHNRASAHL